MRAFSLVELSIVLVILGLLTGGILAGQSLIRAAEVRAVIGESQRIATATNTFRANYMAYPGDMTNATAFWGTAGGSGTGSTCFTVDSSTLADPRRTCNGNGDSYVANTSGALSSDVWYYAERIRAWQHLANAGLLEGSYTGVSDSSTNYYVLTQGKNTPTSKIPTLAYGLYRAVVTSSNWLSNQNKLHLTTTYNSADSGTLTGGQFTTTEAWGLDSKMDDGKPGYGKLQTHKLTSAVAPNCSTSDDPTTATYDLTRTDKACIIRFELE